VDLNGKRVVLTGAASGIGRALLTALSRLPLEIVAADLNEARLLEVCAELPDSRARVVPMVTDVSSWAGNEALFQRALTELGAIDLFIANAGFAHYEHALTPDWERLEGLFRVNTLAPIYALQRMTALNAGRAFKVVWMASAMAQIGLPKYAAYSASKAALHRFADAHRYSMADERALMLVYPIATRTGFFAASSEATPVPTPNQSAEQVAAAVLDGIARDRLEVYPSRLFRIGFWLTLWWPALRRFIQLRELRG
jgi:uncharacterized protein